VLEKILKFSAGGSPIMLLLLANGSLNYDSWDFIPPKQVGRDLEVRNLTLGEDRGYLPHSAPKGVLCCNTSLSHRAR